MTSERKIAANRRNASRSTGPRSDGARARTRRNALRHGLAVITLRDPTISAEVHRLACVICGKDAGPVERQQAVAVAENQLLLLKVRAARVAVIEQWLPMSTTEKEHLSGSELESRVLAGTSGRPSILDRAADQIGPLRTCRARASQTRDTLLIRSLEEVVAEDLSR